MASSPDSAANVGAAQALENQSIENFAASLSTGSIIFGVQILAFLILSGNWKIRRSKKTQEKKLTERQSLFHKIYYYKTAFVPKRKRIAEPTSAWESFKNVFTISDRELIRIAGVDGYLFLEYLQLLLRIFIPMALVILPILLPINRVGDVPGVSGLDSFAWPNVGVPPKVQRLWAHLVLAVCVVIWVCYNVYLALRKFVRLRQTILTMPEHRIRASATTILVQTIPRKWLTVAALDALYDVFPGGIKDIWINRNYDELQEKVTKRLKIARALESAETNLIIACTKSHRKAEEKKEKEAGVKKKSKKSKKHDIAVKNEAITNSMDTQQQGMSTGNPHQIEDAIQNVLAEEISSDHSPSRSSSLDFDHHRTRIPIPIVGQGIQATYDGIRDAGHGVSKLGARMVGGFRGALGGKSGRHHGISQLDGAGDLPTSPISPTTTEFGERAHSAADTCTPLHQSVEEKHEGDATDSDPNSPQSFEKPQSHRGGGHKKALAVIKNSAINPNRHIKDFASPQPFKVEGTEFPLEAKAEENTKYDYTGLYKHTSDEDDELAIWRQYLKPKDRETMRIPLFNKSWWPSLPLLGKKVDTIYYCRKELARLNHEIAEDQANTERFPLMNSAFVQFNHQVAAHMACQSLSHHIPRQMTPRTVEVNPNHVLWDNLSMSWYMRYIRSFFIIALIIALIIFWGIPVSFTGALSQVKTLTETFTFLSWLNKLPPWFISFIQGVLPPAFLGILFVFLPMLLRFLAELTGTTTSGERELLVQNFYFAFVFIQLFLVVSIATGITATIEKLINDPISIPQTLAQNLPKAANYFYSYMILQALSISSGTLLQIGTVFILLFTGFIDTTPRQKVERVLSRPGINWGNMVPVYTNFASIGLIYSVVSPFIMVLMMITFSLFWFTYRYQMIYVSYAKTETNGLIFPRAINQLFTGLYFLELCLIGLFFIQKGPTAGAPCFPHAIIMIVTAAFTVLFQILVNRAFGHLFMYLPITFEDEAAERDEEFQRAQASRWKQDEHEEHQSLTGELEAKERQEKEENQALEAKDEQDRRASKGYRGSVSYEMTELDSARSDNTLPGKFDGPKSPRHLRETGRADRSRSRSRSHSYHHNNSNNNRPKSSRKHVDKSRNPLNQLTNVFRSGLGDVLGEVQRPMRDVESQAAAALPAANLFDDIEDTLEDIEPEARQKLIRRSFQHPATRAIQPCVWIPHDDLGVTKDEIEHTSRMTDKIWITSVNARLDATGKVVYRGLPPDRDPFENLEV